MPHAPALEEVFRSHRRHLWGLAYRLTGSASDADDVVQETFARVVERPPENPELPILPWLVRVATNLSLDALRRRKREQYVGPWLPSAIETGDAFAESTPADRYEILESLTFAFLLALERLTPRERAVLVLRSVFEYDVEETARILRISAGNVKTIHSRARSRMAPYDEARVVPTRQAQQATQGVLREFLAAMGRGDVATMERLLAEAVRAVTDSDGKFIAARSPVLGRARVLRFFDGLSRIPRQDQRALIRMINGLPALYNEFSTDRPGEAPRMVLRCDLAADGRIRELQFVLAPAKLAALTL